MPLLAVPNVTAHPSTATVPVTILLYNGLLICGFNVPINGWTRNSYLLTLTLYSNRHRGLGWSSLPCGTGGRNTNFCCLEVLSADPQNIHAKCHQACLGPAVSEPYGFENVDIATDGHLTTTSFSYCYSIVPTNLYVPPSVRVVNEKERERQAPKTPRAVGSGNGVSLSPVGERCGEGGGARSAEIFFWFFCLAMVHFGAFWALVLMLV